MNFPRRDSSLPITRAGHLAPSCRPGTCLPVTSWRTPPGSSGNTRHGPGPDVDDEVTDEEEVIAAVRALEAADGPLRSRDWPALADARLRQLVTHRLRGLGRQLLPVMDEAGFAVTGYLSTWSDEAARDLARDPSGLQEDDLALLTLIYLHWEILGRVLGESLRSVAEQLDAYEGSTG